MQLFGDSVCYVRIETTTLYYVIKNSYSLAVLSTFQFQYDTNERLRSGFIKDIFLTASYMSSKLDTKGDPWSQPVEYVKKCNINFFLY